MAKKPAAKKRPAKKSAAKKTAKKKPAAKVAKNSVKKTKRKASMKSAEPEFFLGRPKITGEEKLFLLFKDDYQAREVFEFLRVHTVKELEQHSAQDIFRRLTQPMRNTVDRIRCHLAERNRCLTGDEEFAWEWKQEAGGKM